MELAVRDYYTTTTYVVHLDIYVTVLYNSVLINFPKFSLIFPDFFFFLSLKHQLGSSGYIY